MCGHVGIAGLLDHKDETLLRRLLIFDYFRGPDSTGIAVVDNLIETAGIAKIASHPIDLFDTDRFKKLVVGQGYKSKVFLGHNRLATQGKVTGVNAHPFQFGHIVGAHNGTLSAASHKELNERLGEEYTVDSAAIFAHIAAFGVDETIPLLQGAWALVWVDLKDKTINFIRNKERPFWFARSKCLKKLIWGSEYEIIRAAIASTATSSTVSASGYEVRTNKKGHGYFSSEVDMLYSFSLASLSASTSDTDLPVPAVYKELKGKTPPPVVYSAASSWSQGGYYQATKKKKEEEGVENDDDPFPKTRTTCGGSNKHSSCDTPSSVVVYNPMGNPLEGYMEAAELEYLAGGGCHWCGQKIDITAGGFSMWDLGKEVFLLCSDCSPKSDNGNIRVYLPDLSLVGAL